MASSRNRLTPARGPAWQKAKRYGFDMSLLKASLRRTPAERALVHARSLNTVLTLRKAVEKSRG